MKKVSTALSDMVAINPHTIGRAILLSCCDTWPSIRVACSVCAIIEDMPLKSGSVDQTTKKSAKVYTSPWEASAIHGRLLRQDVAVQLRPALPRFRYNLPLADQLHSVKFHGQYTSADSCCANTTSAPPGHDSLAAGDLPGINRRPD